MVKFLAVIVLITVITYFISKSTSNKSTTKQISPKPVIKTTQKASKNKSEDNYLYKSKGIKEFDLKGMYYRNLNPNKHAGLFYGYAKCEQNSHDRYAVGVYNFNNELLGYTPKGNRRLNNSIGVWNNGIVPAWGSLRHDDYNDKWYGYVAIAVGFDIEKSKQIEQFLKLKSHNEELIDKKEKSTEKYFQILNNHRTIKSILNDLGNPKGLDYYFPTSLIPSISSHLEKEKNWKKLIELENHMDLIIDLSEKFKQATLRRIETAKKTLSNQK
jgi:hypothetical protein